MTGGRKSFFSYLIFILVIFLAGCADKRVPPPVAENGVIDLSSWNITNNPPLELKGEWEFYWQTFLLSGETEEVTYQGQGYPSVTYDYSKPSVNSSPELVNFPSLWTSYKDRDGQNLPSFGYATYRLIIKNDKELKNISFEVPDFYTSYRLWLNGKIISENGEIGTNKNDSRPFWLMAVKGVEVIPKNSEIVLEISNFVHSKGGSNSAILIGSSKMINLKRDSELVQTFTLTGILFMGGVFFLGLFMFGKKENYILYFSLFCFTYSYRVFGTGLYYIHNFIDEKFFLITSRAEYISLFLSTFLFAKFTKALYPRETSATFIKAFSYITYALIGLVLFTPIYIFSQTIDFYAVIMLSSFLYIFYVFIRALINKRDGAVFSLLGVCVLLFVSAANIIIYYNFISFSPFLAYLGYILFFLFQSIVLAYRFERSFHKSEQEAVAGLKAKSEFLATISHEIRTPMNGVIGMIELLRRTELSEEQKDYLETIKTSSNNLLDIINEILDYSKIESGKLKIEYNYFDLADCIEEVIRLFYFQASEKGIELDFYIEPDVPGVICSDYNRLKQVLSNLINNAVKFTEKGEVILTVKVEGYRKNTYQLYFEIKDTGIGIPKNKTGNLFSPFSQVDSSSSRKYGGTGLGLVISRNLVEAMGGTISFESTENQGTTFYFNIKTEINEFLPVYKKYGKELSISLFIKNHTIKSITQSKLENSGFTITTKKTDLIIADIEYYQENTEQLIPILKAHSAILLTSPGRFDEVPPELFRTYLTRPVKAEKLLATIRSICDNTFPLIITAKSGSKENKIHEIKVLLAEDNKINQKVALKILEKIVSKSDTAENGYEVLEAMKKENYDLIFMDMHMPGMDGITTTQEIRASGIRYQPVIIALTANAMEEDRQKCFEAGMNDYVSKPVKIDEISAIINKWFPDF